MFENGADVNAVDMNGDTPMHYTLTLHNDEVRYKIVVLLIENGASINININMDNYSKDAQEYLKNKAIEIIETKQTSDLEDQSDSDGITTEICPGLCTPGDDSDPTPSST